MNSKKYYKIGIDVLADVPGQSGAVNVHRNLLKYLPPLEPNWTFYVFCTPRLEKYYKEHGARHKNIKWIYCWADNNDGSLKRIMIQEVQIPYFAVRYNLHCLIARPQPFIFPFLKIPSIYRYTTTIPNTFHSLKEIYVKYKILFSAISAKGVLCSSNTALKNLESSLNKKIKKSFVIWESFDEEIFSKNIYELRKFIHSDLAFISNCVKKVILVPTGIQRRKNSIVVFEAIEKLLKENISDFIVVFMGRNERIYLNIIKERYKHLLNKNVIFITGFRSHYELAFVAKYAMIAIYPSKNETFGVPPLEMMYCGVPTIASNIETIIEISGGGVLLFNPNSSDDLAQCIKLLLKNKEKRMMLAKNGNAHVQKYSWEQSIIKTRDAIKSIISNRN